MLKKVHSVRFVLKIRVESLAFVQTEADCTVLAVETLNQKKTIRHLAYF